MHHFRGLMSKLSSSASKERLKKEEHSLNNGGVLLEEFMALCDGKCRIPLRYFSAVEIERSMKDADCRLYSVGRHMVTGLLDKRFVLVNLFFKKIPGCSWIEINGVVHAFVGGDQSHPQSDKINEKLKELWTEMKTLGYSAESSFVYQDVDEEKKGQILLYHSEKLAVAFALLRICEFVLTAIVR